MKIRIYKCCWFDSLRTVCVLIGWYLVVFSILYLAAIPFHEKDGPIPKEATARFTRKYGTYISVPSAIVSLAAGMSDLLAAHKKISYLMLSASSLLLILTISCVLFAIWAMVENSIPLFVSLLVLAVINACFDMMLISYYLEMKEDEVKARESSITDDVETTSP